MGERQALLGSRAFPRWLKWLAPAVLVVELVLVMIGLLNVRQAALIALALEIALAVVAGGLALAAGSQYRSLRGQGMPRQRAFLAALTPVVPGPAVTVLRHELGVLSALWLGVRRRREVPQGGVPLDYGRDQRPVLAAILVLSIVEMVVVALVVPWAWLETLLLMLSAYGLVWIIAFPVSMFVRPHVVADDRLLLRCAHFGKLSVPTHAVLSARKSLKSGHRKVLAQDGDTVALALAGSTNVTVRLVSGTVVVANDEQRLSVSAVSFMVDEPDLAIAALQAVTRQPL